MEVAPMKPFLNSMNLFSLMYDGYEKDLKEEIWSCHKYMKLSMEEVMRLPRHERKAYIKIHNKLVDEENRR